MFLNCINNPERHIHSFEGNSLSYIVLTHLVATLNRLFENRIGIIYARPESTFFWTVNINIGADQGPF